MIERLRREIKGKREKKIVKHREKLNITTLSQFNKSNKNLSNDRMKSVTLNIVMRQNRFEQYLPSLQFRASVFQFVDLFYGYATPVRDLKVRMGKKRKTKEKRLKVERNEVVSRVSYDFFYTVFMAKYNFNRKFNKIMIREEWL